MTDHILLVVFGTCVLAAYVAGALSVVFLSQPNTRTRERTAQRVVCTACDDRAFRSQADAREHAMSVHEAPSPEAADHILTIREVSA